MGLYGDAVEGVGLRSTQEDLKEPREASFEHGVAEEPTVVIFGDPIPMLQLEELERATLCTWEAIESSSQSEEPKEATLEYEIAKDPTVAIFIDPLPALLL